jgi:hypothetical protein
MLTTYVNGMEIQLAGPVGPSRDHELVQYMLRNYPNVVTLPGVSIDPETYFFMDEVEYLQVPAQPPYGGTAPLT